MTTPLTIPCPICGTSMRLSITTNRHGKHAIGISCPVDGRHLRGFINHRPFVEDTLRRLAEANDERVLEALQNPGMEGTR